MNPPNEMIETNAAQRSSLQAWRLTAWIAAAFTVLLAVTMFVGHVRVRAQDPWKSPRLAELKQKLQEQPKDEQVKQEIRSLDLKLRERYFRQMSRMESGVYLLIGGVALFVLAATRSRARQKNLPDLAVKSEDPTTRYAAASRWSVAVTGGAIGLGLFLLSFTWTSAVPRSMAAAETLLGSEKASGGGAASATDRAEIPSTEEYQRNWPRFLGPLGNGSINVKSAPLKWDAESGTGIAWKMAAPVAGFNSPLVWGNRVFFSGGDAAKREVVCLNANTGETLWRQAVADVPGSPKTLPEIPESTGFAAPTMATDGSRVYVIFANADVAAFTLNGERVWARYVGPLHNIYGHANSLNTYRDRLILQLDQGDVEEGKSKLVALDGATGKTVWETTRKVGASWASPLVFDHTGKSQVVVLSIPWAMAYSAEDGKELWRADTLNGEVTPTPIYAGDFVLVPSPSEKLSAIRPDGSGDVSKSHVSWIFEEGVPDVTSPASNGELVFILTTSGFLTCVDVKDGAKVWEHDFETEFHASPAIAAGNVYLFGQKGESIVLAAAREFKELHHTTIPDSFHASPAIVDGTIFVRGVTNVWALKEGEGK
jgi:outer membrane protein assembly factor BamB